MLYCLRPMVHREYYIDRLRTVMTAMVLFAHSAITYGGTGNWFYTEIQNQQSRSSILLTLYIVTCNAVLMGFFFLLAGYFTPASLEHKGYRRFVLDRCLRLGLPLLTFGLVIAPLTIAMVARAGGHGFTETLLGLSRSREFVNGPMWFAEALLIFSFGYCLYRGVTGRKDHSSVEQRSATIPRSRTWILSALAVGLAALLIRQVFPVDERVLGLWLADFATYIFLYALGVAAWRRNWLNQLTWHNARLSIIIACVAWPILPFAVAVFAASGRTASTVRGFDAANVALAFWEPLVAWGAMAAAILWFRTRFNQPSRFWSWLGRRAYAVYVIHPFTLVAFSLMLRHWHGQALIKFCVTGIAACVVTWLVADPLVRLPGVRHIL